MMIPIRNGFDAVLPTGDEGNRSWGEPILRGTAHEVNQIREELFTRGTFLGCGPSSHYRIAIARVPNLDSLTISQVRTEKYWNLLKWAAQIPPFLKNFRQNDIALLFLPNNAYYCPVGMIGL